MIEVCRCTHVLSIHILTSEAGHDGLDRAAHHRAHLPPLPLPQNMPQHRRARHQLPGRARNEHSRKFYNEVSAHLSPGVSLISDLANDSGILQSELFTSRSQNLVLAKLPNSGFWRYGQFFK